MLLIEHRFNAEIVAQQGTQSVTTHNRTTQRKLQGEKLGPHQTSGGELKNTNLELVLE
jgi:hypothetical protein